MKLEILEHLPDNSLPTPPILFIHGAYHGAWCWEENFLPYFSSKGFPAYAISLRGHGRSEGYNKLDSYSLNDYMDDVLKVIQTFEKPPILIGHSMGGGVVQKILFKHPEKLKAAVLLASIPPNGGAKNIIRLLILNFRKIIQISMTNNEVKKANFIADTLFSNELPVEKRGSYIRMLQKESRKAKKDMLKQIVPRFARTKVPLLVIGSQKDWWYSEKITLGMGKIYKTKPIMLKNVSHDMMLDPNWSTVADHILAFLTESIS